MPLPKAQQIDWLHHDNEWLRKAEEVAEKDDNELFEWEVNQKLKAERKKDDNELVEWEVNQKLKAERIAAGPRPPRSAPPWLRKAEEVAEKDDNELVEWGVNQKPKAERIAAGPRPPRSAPPPHLLQPDEWVRI